ncbi:MAG TPA: hypothetical protein VHY08_01930 [Bacillota bacterium]|nr:hypothetical protein [Bacillota bacterium]
MVNILQKRPFGLKGGAYSLSIRTILVTLLIITYLTGCLVSPFEQKALDQDKALKIEALALMDKAVEDYDLHQDQINALTVKIDAAIAYEKSRPKNEITVKMWTDGIKKPCADFFEIWQKEGKTSQIYVDGKKEQISDSFDQIIQFEEAKKQDPAPTKTK